MSEPRLLRTPPETTRVWYVARRHEHLTAKSPKTMQNLDVLFVSLDYEEAVSWLAARPELTSTRSFALRAFVANVCLMQLGSTSQFYAVNVKPVDEIFAKLLRKDTAAQPEVTS